MDAKRPAATARQTKNLSHLRTTVGLLSSPEPPAKVLVKTTLEYPANGLSRNHFETKRNAYHKPTRTIAQEYTKGNNSPIKRQLRTVQGPWATYDADRKLPVKNGYAKVNTERKFNNSSNMQKALQQPFVTLSPGKKPVGDPKCITRGIPLHEKPKESPKQPMHRKGNISKMGSTCFYLF